MKIIVVYETFLSAVVVANIEQQIKNKLGEDVEVAVISGANQVFVLE